MTVALQVQQAVASPHIDLAACDFDEIQRDYVPCVQTNPDGFFI